MTHSGHAVSCGWRYSGSVTFTATERTTSMIQITEITRGYASYAEREADIEALRAEGYDHFTTYRDTAAEHALCYGRTPKAEIRHHWSKRDNPATRQRIRYALKVLINQRDMRKWN